MKAMGMSALAAIVLAVGFAAPAEAQRRNDDDDDDRYEWESRDRNDDDDDRYDRRRRDDDRRSADRSRSGRYERRERGDGPSFCRSGRGHPVFGWDWCRERGWDRAGRVPVRWEQRGWEDVIFGRPRDSRKTTLDRRDLGEVLGDVVFGRIDTRRRHLGGSDAWAGRWVTSREGRELWVTAGGVPIARLLDRDGDRRVDAIWLAER